MASERTLKLDYRSPLRAIAPKPQNGPLSQAFPGVPRQPGDDFWWNAWKNADILLSYG